MAASRSPLCLHFISWKMLVLVLVTVSSWLPSSEPAAVANTQYTMDQRSDCLSAGFLDIPRGQITKLVAPSKDTSTTTQVLSCRLQFSVQTEGDTLRMTLTTGSFIEDCDVSLELQMANSNSGKIIRGCKSGTGAVPVLEAVNGKASIWLARGKFENQGYWVEVTVTAVRTEAGGIVGTSSTADVGLIVGVTAGVIALIVIVVIICVCCYRKRRGGDNENFKSEQDKDIIKNSKFTDSVHGYENNMAKISYDDSFQKSPDSGRKLLSHMSKNDDTSKPKSALERFGHTPTYRGQSNVESRQTNAGRGTEQYEERDFGKARTTLEDREPVKLRDISVQKSVRDKPTDTNNLPSKSPVLAALHNNPKFRKSFHDNEEDAEERVRRVSDRSSVTNSSSAESESLPVTKPRLPPVPKSPPRSPSPQRQGEKIAGIFRAGHSSTSSSEITRLESEESEDRDGKVKHTLRPNRGKNTKSSRKQKDEQSDDDTDERRRREKERKGEKLRTKHKDEKSDDDTDERRRREKERKGEKLTTKHKDEKRTKSDDNEKRQKKERGPGSVDESDDRSQYKEHEGRFKKSASGRKPKGKGQKMGRSRSTGNALEELDSNYQNTRSKSPSSVRSLILAEDDDNDDELDSNYASFKRSGSKTSLYASRSSLYGRRRKNSIGETMSMSSYMHDDIDSRMGDFDRPHLSHREKERLFKSTGDLDVSSASAVIFRECATQTGNSKEVYIYGRRTVIRSRPEKLFSRGTQTSSGKERRDSTGSARSGRSARSNHLKSRSKSQESLRKQKSSRLRDFSDDVSERSHHRRHHKHQDRDHSDDDNVSERGNPRRHRKSRDIDLSDNEDKQSRHHSESTLNDDDYSDKRSRRSKPRDTDSDSYKPKQKPKTKSRKLRSTASNDFSGSDDDKSTVISSTAPSSIQQVGHIPHFIPTGYPLAYQQPGLAYPQPGVAYPQPGVAYISTAPGGPPMMVPVGSVPQSAIPQKPSIAPKPNATKWDQLVNLTEGMKKRRHQMGESIDTESVLSSTWTQPMPYSSHPQVHYSQSPYTATQRMPESDSLYGSSYPESIDITKLPKERITGYSRRYAPADSNC